MLTVKQKNGELLKEFADQFNKEKLKVYNLDETIAIVVFCSGVQNTKCAASFHRNRPKTLVDLTEKVGKYVDTEELLKIKNSNQADDGSSQSNQKQDILEKDTCKIFKMSSRKVVKTHY